MTNLDALAARAAETMCAAIGMKCKKDEQIKPEQADGFFTKALGMVQESGIYAAVVYMQYRGGDWTEVSGADHEEVLAAYALSALLNLLREPALASMGVAFGKEVGPGEVNGSKPAVRRHAAAICEKGSETVFLTKELWERALTYARYTARGQKKARARGAGS